MHLRQPRGAHGLERALEGCVVLGREADDHIGREVEVGERLQLAEVGLDRVAPRHCAQNGVVAGLERHVQVRADDRRLVQGRDEVVVDVVDLDRREPQALDALDRAGGADQAGQRHPGGAVAEATEVDAREDDLTMALGDAPADLSEHRVGAAAAGGAADERDHAERTRERAAVLDLHERAHAVEPRVRLHAADRADIAGDRLDGLLDLAGTTVTFAGSPAKASFESLAPHPVT